MRLGVRSGSLPRRVMKCAGRAVLTVLTAAVILIVYAVAVEPRLLDVERETAPIPELPPSWEGERVALLADWQVGMWLANTGTVREAVRRLIEERPTAVLIVGDFVYKAGADPDDELRVVAELLRPLGDAGIPTYAVLGNHDWGMLRPDGVPDERLAARVRDTLEREDVRVLHNEAVPLRSGRRSGAPPLYLVGVGARWPDRDRPGLALAGVPSGAPRLVLMHNPGSFGAMPAGSAPVAVAGHTHGGQVRVPFTPEWTWMTFVKEDAVHADGWIDGYGAPGNRLYVNRGIGFSVLPIRFNCPPELTIFTLRDASSGSDGANANRRISRVAEHRGLNAG